MRMMHRKIAVGAPGCRSGHNASRGFTLIEVLIGVLVLGLGLLGIAAVFPVVVRQQRIATDSVQGLSVQRSAEAYIRAHAGFNVAIMPNGPRGANLPAWDNMRRSSNSNADADTGASRWVVPEIVVSGTSARRGNLYVVGGETSIPTLQVPLVDRLWRPPFSDRDVLVTDQRYGNEPKYVWDMVWRRIEAGAAIRDDDLIQVAIIVRRVDPSLRLPVGTINVTNDPLQRTQRSIRIADALTNVNIANENRRVPVAVDNDGNPTLTGVGNYGVPFVLRVREVTDDQGNSNGPPGRNLVLRRFVFDSTQPLAVRAARQINQKLIDTRGNVYTVIRVDSENANAVLIDPPAPADATRQAADGWFDVVLTPQVAVSAGVFTVRP
jgi:prepilin-type N-terminal cleavage/methylation domain-containing protein